MITHTLSLQLGSDALYRCIEDNFKPPGGTPEATGGIKKVIKGKDI
ncbi:unnamed protein product [marine sediment metagenome]|uniref:Uncharacterized protein n=1 Tax=marine sediment metagenome TaxID=412755 RepID=X1KXF7_9ZZZZ